MQYLRFNYDYHNTENGQYVYIYYGYRFIKPIKFLLIMNIFYPCFVGMFKFVKEFRKSIKGDSENDLQNNRANLIK